MLLATVLVCRLNGSHFGRLTARIERRIVGVVVGVPMESHVGQVTFGRARCRIAVADAVLGPELRNRFRSSKGGAWI